MYIPKTFRKDNSEQIFEFIKENSFATLVSCVDNQPFASHIPIDLMTINGNTLLTGHLSRANTQLDSLNKNKNVMIIFLGNNHYISSKWYNHENVPTWNYIAVQIKGTLELVTEQEKLIEFLTLQIDKYENKVNSNLKLNHLSENFLNKEIKGIVGFKISIDKIDVAYKLSQNRNQTDYFNIVTELQKLNTTSSNLLASEMKTEFIDRKIKECFENELTFKIVSSENEFNEVFLLREKCFSKNKNYLLSVNSEQEKTGQDKYDKDSLIYTVESNNQLIGSCRITPLSKYDLISDFDIPQSSSNIVFSRVCIENKYRNKNLHIFMFYKFSQWILNTTHYTDYYAFCTDDEYRLYEKLGAKKIMEYKIKLYNNQPNDYYVVKGNIKDFNNSIFNILNTIQNGKQL
jgi:transcriptional regulator